MQAAVANPNTADAATKIANRTIMISLETTSEAKRDSIATPRIATFYQHCRGESKLDKASASAGVEPFQGSWDGGARLPRVKL
jgi:hypothetical protein